MRVVIVAAVLSVLACVEDQHVFLPDPAPGMRSEILAIDDGQALALYARAVDDTPFEFPGRYDIERGLRVESLQYVEPLSAIGLQAGLLKPTSERHFFRFLPDPAQVFEAALPESTWVERAAPSKEVRATRLPTDGSQCPSYRVEAVGSLEEGGAPRFVVPFTEGRPVLGNDSGRILLVSAEGTSFTEVFTSPRQPGLRSAWPEADGVLWISTTTAALWRGRFDAGSSTLALDSMGAGVAELDHIDGGLRDGDAEIFSLSDDGAVQRCFRRVCTLVDRVDALGDRDIAWSGPGEAIVVGGGTVQPWRATEDALVPVDAQLTAPASAVTRFAGGVAVGSAKGEISVRDAAGQWTVVARRTDEIRIRAMVAYGDGVLFGDFEGEVGLYTPSGGLCPPQVVSGFNIMHMAPVGERDVLMAGLRDLMGGRLPYARIEVTPAP